ncbi:MAG: tRNA-uridine aminocarboxypropyltransferase [Alphaproteobacteria bacterium]
MSETCNVCEKPVELCVCEKIGSLENKIDVLILRHPQEQDRILGTAKIVNLQLKNSSVKTGLSWANLEKALGYKLDSKKVGVLYLGTAKTKEALPPNILTAISKKGTMLDNQEGILNQLKCIILLDGNWSQAKALWWRNPWLLKCQRLVLQPPRLSFYGRLRKEPRKESVSTIEAVAYTLAVLENDMSLIEKILPPFHLLLEKVKNRTKNV